MIDLLRRCLFGLLILIAANQCWATEKSVVQNLGEQASIPSLISALRLDPAMNFCGEPVPFGEQEVRERLEKELLLILWDRPQIVLWLKRAGRYFPYIEQALAKNGLPDDLKYVAVIESSLLPEAGSAKRAEGLWQFIKSTGRRYGLAIDRDIDQRRNYRASTDAAIRYFKDLHGKFNSWTLAVAAYNMGEDRLGKRLEEQEVDNYYKSHLPGETLRYIPRIIVAKEILANPARYGFKLAPSDLYQPFKTDQVSVTSTSRIPISLVAKSAGSYFKKIKTLNPEFKRGIVTKGHHRLFLPKGSGGLFEQQFPKLLAQWEEKNRKTTYVVKNGDNLSVIAERFSVPLSALLAWNDLSSKDFIHPGKRLVIFR